MSVKGQICVIFQCPWAFHLIFVGLILQIRIDRPIFVGLILQMCDYCYFVD